MPGSATSVARGHLLVFAKELLIFLKKLFVLRDDQRFQCGEIQRVEIGKFCALYHSCAQYAMTKIPDK